MKKTDEILKKLTELLKPRPVIYTAVVKSVSESDFSAKVEVDDLVYTARLNAAKKDFNGLVQIPTVGSDVLVARLDEEANVFVIIAFTALDKVYLKGSDNGGLINVADLVTKLNELAKAFNTHTHTVATTGTAAAQSGTAAVTVQTAQLFKKSDFEDETVKH